MLKDNFIDVEIITRWPETEGLIDDLIKELEAAKAKGSTHYKFRFEGEYKLLFTCLETVKLKEAYSKPPEVIYNIYGKLRGAIFEKEDFDNVQIVINDTPKIHPSNYNIAIKNNGRVFRIPKDADYGEEISVDEYAIQYGDRPCAFRNKYFDLNGKLRQEYWCLPKLLNK